MSPITFKSFINATINLIDLAAQQPLIVNQQNYTPLRKAD